MTNRPEYCVEAEGRMLLQKEKLLLCCPRRADGESEMAFCRRLDLEYGLVFGTAAEIFGFTF